MARYCIYIDGFNVYYALQELSYQKYKWVNYRKLAESVIGKNDQITGVFYFTAIVRWKPDNARRHKIYMRALRWAGVDTIQGRFQDKHVRCHKCNQIYKTHEEKRTDVNIALKVLCDAIDELYDKALIVSADSDLLPAIHAVRKYAPEKRIGVMFPIGRTNNDLGMEADFRIKMSQRLLSACQFPEQIKIGSTIIKRPDDWPSV
jgi:uncharacterized LabA/DUF88 family protein